MKDNKFVSPPGALRFTKKKVQVTDVDMMEANEVFDAVCEEMNATPVDETTLEMIRAKKKHQTNTPATVQQ